MSAKGESLNDILASIDQDTFDDAEEFSTTDDTNLNSLHLQSMSLPHQSVQDAINSNKSLSWAKPSFNPLGSASGKYVPIKSMLTSLHRVIWIELSYSITLFISIPGTAFRDCADFKI